MNSSNQSTHHSQPTPSDSAAELTHALNNKLYKEFDLHAYCTKLGLTDEAERYLAEAAHAPSRHANGFRSNTVRVPSPEFGHTVGAESTSLEYAFILITKGRPEVLRIYEQGPKVKIQGTTTAGGNYTFSFTPDFVVLTDNGIEIIELENLAESAGYFLKQKNRYVLVDGHYTSPPVEEHYGKLNFKFRILAEDDLDERYAQNARFIHPYQVGHPRIAITEEEKIRLLDVVRHNPGILLTAVPFHSDPRRVEVAYHLIAQGELFTHLSECPLEKPDRVRLFPTPQQERAFLLLRQTTRRKPADIKSLGYLLVPGSLIDIVGQEYRVRRVGANDVILVDSRNGECQLPHQALLDLKPRIGGIYNAEKTFEGVLAEATPEDLLEFQFRKNAISPYLEGNAKAHETPHDRTVRRWRDDYEKERLKTGVGLAGIFPGHYRCGNRVPRLNTTVEGLIDHVIGKYHLTSAAETVTNTHLRILALGRRLKIAASQLPSYCTIARRCAAIDPYKKSFRRQGKRVANKYRPIYRGKSPLGSPHGQKSFMVAHCDSTQLDLARTHENQETQIEHLWHTKMVDAFDGRVLATHTSEQRPCADTLEALMLDCIEKHGALPSTIVVDWGSEHRNIWMETTLARIGVNILYRPKATPGSGAPVESYFAKLVKELIHNIAGNTKLLKQARQVTKAVDPRNHTIWSKELILELLGVYYKTLNDTPRRNRPSPNAMAAACEAQFGQPPVQVVDRDMFRRIILPYVDGVKRKVSPRGTIRCGNYTYGADELRFYAGKFVDVRHDRKEPRLVFADHPAQRRVIECSVVSTDIKYADDADDAIRMVEEADRHRQTSGQDIQEHRVDFTETLIDLEAKAEAQQPPRPPKRKSKPKEHQTIDASQTLAPIIPLKLETIV